MVKGSPVCRNYTVKYCALHFAGKVMKYSAISSFTLLKSIPHSQETLFHLLRLRLTW